MDQRGQVRAQLDALVVPRLRGLPSSASASCGGVQPRELPSEADVADGREALVAHDAARQADQVGAKIVRRARYVTFQMAEVAISRDLFRSIPGRIRSLADAAPMPFG